MREREYVRERMKCRKSTSFVRERAGIITFFISARDAVACAGLSRYFENTSEVDGATFSAYTENF